MKHAEQYIKVTSIRNNMDHDCIAYIKASSIMSFGEAHADYAKVGGAATLDVLGGGMYVLAESFQEILEMLSKIEVSS